MSPKFVKPQNVRVGDIIRVAWKTGAVQRSITAKVASRDYEYSTRILLSEDGQEILRYNSETKTDIRVTMLARGEAGLALEQLTLFDELREAG